MLDQHLKTSLQNGLVIPASPLALTPDQKLDERRQRALWRYYLAAGAGGIAIAVHTTQFEIRRPDVGLFQPLLALAKDEFDLADRRNQRPIRIGGVIGPTHQAVREATMLRDAGFHAALLGLGALRDADDDQLIQHCTTIARVIPLVGFYLQPAAGGRLLPYSFWRRFAEIPQVVAIKIAPFNRYQTLDVIRAVIDAGRDDIALYTGNDDNILVDLVTPFTFMVNGRPIVRRIVGGLLGHWAVWTRRAVELHQLCRQPNPPLDRILALSAQVTDANAALFDAANGFAGCIPGIHEILRRQGLLDRITLLDENARLSPDQSRELDRVCRDYPHLIDDDFVARHRDKWLK